MRGKGFLPIAMSIVLVMGLCPMAAYASMQTGESNTLQASSPSTAYDSLLEQLRSDVANAQAEIDRHEDLQRKWREARASMNASMQLQLEDARAEVARAQADKEAKDAAAAQGASDDATVQAAEAARTLEKAQRLVTELEDAMATSCMIQPDPSSYWRAEQAVTQAQDRLDAAGDLTSATIASIPQQTLSDTGVRPPVKVTKTFEGVDYELVEGVHFTVTYGANANAGSQAGHVTVTGVGEKGDGATWGSKKASFSIVARNKTTAKAANTAKVSITRKVKTISASKLKKKARTANFISVENAKGEVTFTKVKKGSSELLTVNKTTGKVKVKRGAKTGTYKVRIKVNVAGNENYKPLHKTVTAKVRVK